MCFKLKDPLVSRDGCVIFWSMRYKWELTSFPEKLGFGSGSQVCSNKVLHYWGNVAKITKRKNWNELGSLRTEVSKPLL